MVLVAKYMKYALPTKSMKSYNNYYNYHHNNFITTIEVIKIHNSLSLAKNVCRQNERKPNLHAFLISLLLFYFRHIITDNSIITIIISISILHVTISTIIL